MATLEYHQQAVDRLSPINHEWCTYYLNSGLIKSRLLRMSIFDIVDRDFIYLDSDIVALRKFDELWQSDINMGAVSDFNTPPDQPKLLARAVDRFKAMQWEVPKRYFNSGVLVVKANDANREFFRRWREAYDACLEKGLFLDQTSFNRTVELMGDEIGFTPLDNKFNAQVAIDLSQAKKGALIHFWASSNDKPSLMSHLLSRFEKDGTIDYAAIAECGKVGHPWPPNPPAWRLMESRNWWHALLAKLGIRIYKA